MVKNTVLYVAVLFSILNRTQAQDITIAQGVHVLVEFESRVNEDAIEIGLDEAFLEVKPFDGGLLIKSMGEHLNVSGVDGGNIIVSCENGYKFSINFTFTDTAEKKYYYIENNQALNWGRKIKASRPSITASSSVTPTPMAQQAIEGPEDFSELMKPKCNVSDDIGQINLTLGGIKIKGDSMTVGLYVLNRSKVDFQKQRVVFSKGVKQKKKKADYELNTHNDLVLPYWSQEYDIIPAKDYKFFVFKFQRDVIDRSGFWNISLTEEGGDRGSSLEVSGDQFNKCIISD